MSDDDKMEDEFEAHLRATKTDNIGSALKGIKFRDQSSIEQFNTTVEAVFNKLNEVDTIFKRGDISYILDSIDKLDRPGYKNAVSYILGYYVRSFNKKDVEKIFSILPIINDFSVEFPIFKVTKQDIIRYGRLWNNIEKL